MPGGERVPIAFFPRFSTFSSGDATTYWSQPMDMLGFESIQLEVFRSKMVGTTPTLEFYAQDSMAGVDFDDMTTAWDPAAGSNIEAAAPKSLPITQRYVRLGLKIMGTNPVVTVYAIGWAARTQS